MDYMFTFPLKNVKKLLEIRSEIPTFQNNETNPVTWRTDYGNIQPAD